MELLKNDMPAKILLNNEQLEKVKFLFSKGRGTRLIAAELGVARSTIKNYLIKLGLHDSKRGTPARPYLASEKLCKYCQTIKPIKEFKLINYSKGRQRYRYCILCEKIFIKLNNVRYINNKIINNDNNYLINKKVSRVISFLIKYPNNVEVGNCLPYTIEELKKSLESKFESWMNWNNYGSYNKDKWKDNDQSTWTWQIDHIIPKSTFLFNSIKDVEFIKCWSLDNLRPLSSKQNLLDGVKRTRHKTV